MSWIRSAAPLLILVAMGRAGPDAAPMTVSRALAWVEEQGEAPLSAWHEASAGGGQRLKVAVSARGVDEEAMAALFKTYSWPTDGAAGDPEESIALDEASMLRHGAQQTILGLSPYRLSHFAKCAQAATTPEAPVFLIEPRRWLREPRIHVTVGLLGDGRKLLRYHAITGERIAPGERIDFEAWEKDRAPASFRFARTGQGRHGRWVVRERADAAEGRHVLVQEEDDPTDFRFPLAILEDVSMLDGKVFVKCRPLTGSVDQAVGIVFRYRDEDNYYMTRANTLEGNVRLYYVKKGQRIELASYDGPVEANRWHDYGVKIEGSKIEVSWRGQRVITCEDSTFPEEGAVGLWTKADSVSEFDSLIVTPEE